MPKPLLSDSELHGLLRGLFLLKPPADIWRFVSGLFSTEIRSEEEWYALQSPKELQFEEFTVFFYAFHFWTEDRPTVTIQFSTRRRWADCIFPQSVIRLRKLLKKIADDTIVGTEWTQENVVAPPEDRTETGATISYLYERRASNFSEYRLGPNSALQMSWEHHHGKNFVILDFDGRNYELRPDGCAQLAVY